MNMANRKEELNLLLSDKLGLTPPKGGIRWRKQDVAKLKRLVKSYTVKRDREISKNEELAERLPVYTVDEIRKDISSRAEYNRWISKLQRFQRYDATDNVKNPQGVVATKWELREIRNDNAAINARRRANYKKFIEGGGEEILWGADVYERFRPRRMKFEEFPSQRAYERYAAGSHRMTTIKWEQESTERYKQNYLRAWDEELGDVDPELRELIEEIDPYLFMVLSYRDPELEIGFVYPMQGQEEMKASIIRNRLELWGVIDAGGGY